MLKALEKTLKAKSGLKQCGNESLEVGWLWGMMAGGSLGTVEGSDPQDSGFSAG